MQDFSNKTAVVTGAASGIGFELAKIFAEQGMKIVLADIEQGALNIAAEKLRAEGADCITAICDVGETDDVERLAETAIKHYGAIHIACNNAGVFTGGTLWEATLDDYEWLMRVNQWGVINGIRSFVPRMIALNEPCHLVNTASMAAVTSMPYSGIYNMTKHAVLALSECLYHELAFAGSQVKVTCVCPEMFNTGIGQSERNRPAELGEVTETDSRALTRESIQEAARTGKPPREIAERVLQAIKDEQFYVLAEDAWRNTANARLDDIRAARNPVFTPPV